MLKQTKSLLTTNFIGNLQFQIGTEDSCQKMFAFYPLHRIKINLSNIAQVIFDPRKWFILISDCVRPFILAYVQNTPIK